MKKSLFFVAFIFVCLLLNVRHAFSMNNNGRNDVEILKELNVFTAQHNRDIKKYEFAPNEIIKNNGQRHNAFLFAMLNSTVDMQSKLLKSEFKLDRDIQTRNRFVKTETDCSSNCSRSNFLLVSKDSKNNYNYIGQYSCITPEELLNNIKSKQFKEDRGFIVKQQYDPFYSNEVIKEYNYLPLSKFLWRYRFMISVHGILGIIGALFAVFGYERCMYRR
jgi:hypothetical protein